MLLRFGLLLVFAGGTVSQPVRGPSHAHRHSEAPRQLRDIASAPGVRFTVNVAPRAKPGIPSVAGRIEFAAGRGRFDVTAVPSWAPLSYKGVTVGAPLARPGDYYLFDTTSFILVRPSDRTFSAVSLATSTYRHGNVSENWDSMMQWEIPRTIQRPMADRSTVAFWPDR
jgi:hypothetical protein